jgi:phospholipid/cholesterol/gamma-HCH transport system ATP-binding protein
MAPVIQLSDLCKLHPTPGQPPVLEGVSLAVQAGETCGLCGPGASGKSLLLKILCGLLRPDAGEVTIEGVRLSTASAPDWGKVQARIGMLFQNNALFDSLTVFENVAFPLRQRARLERQRVDEAALTDRVLESLRGVGLAEQKDKAPSMLSGGQRKRVALARAVVTRPPIIVYDEPTAGLDPVTTAKIYELLERERALTSATVLIVSSDVPALRRFASRMLMLHGGRLRYDGPSAAMEDGDPVVRQFVRGELEGPL